MATFDIEVRDFDETTGRATFIAIGTDGEVSHTVRCDGQIDQQDVEASVKAKILPTLANAYAEAVAATAAAEAAVAIKTRIAETLKIELEKVKA